MAKINLDYYTNADQYSDGDIENKMLKIAEEGRTLEMLEADEVTFPIVYHFSKIRENILNWYSFKEHASVLEIGAGCGAITGMLCENAENVTSVELSKRRASINYARHKDYDNLEIMVGNLNDMNFEKQYDYIVLNGVLEYAASFTEGEKPYQGFLRKLKKYLKSDGRFLIAIENRLGLKYFSGAPEDHTDIYFYGLERYPNNNNVKTFSKKELQSLLEDCGLFVVRFYYPYPDYKFPSEIFTDDTIKTSSYGRAYKNFTENRVALFDENKVTHDLVNEGIADVFANSFLVEAGMNSFDEKDHVLYVKINRERKEEFQTYTVIHETSDRKYVSKNAITSKAKEFVNQVAEYAKIPVVDGYKNLMCECKNGSIQYAYLNDKNMMDVVWEFVEAGNREAIISLLKNFYDCYFINKKTISDIYTNEFCEVFGKEKGHCISYECVSPANVDLICDNIFISEDSVTIIDYEWYFEFNVPVSFIMWRLLNEMYHKEPRLFNLIEQSVFYSMFHIEEDDVATFLNWSIHFAYEYVGSDSHMKYAQENIKIDLGIIVQKEYQRKHMSTKLYYDSGHGLNEHECIEQHVLLCGNRFQVKFDLSEISHKEYYRWDIQMNNPGKIFIDKLSSNCQFSLIPQSVKRLQDNVYECDETKASFVIDIYNPDDVEYLEFEGRIKYYTVQEMMEDKEELVIESEVLQKAVDESTDQIHKITEEMKTQMLINSSYKGIIRNMIRRVKRSIVRNDSEQSQKALSRTSGSIDMFHYENGILYCRGWLYDYDYPIKNGMIVYYADDERVGQHKFITIYRSDVAQALNDEKALKSGFTFNAQIQTSKNLRVVLEYDIPVGKGCFELGGLPANISSGETQIVPYEGDGQIGNISQFKENSVIDKLIIPGEVYQHEIDIIIPVYNGYEFFDELFAGLKLTNMKYRLLIVNDMSPDERVRPYLEAYASTHSNVILMHNEENLGFVKSVNRALKSARNHVVLLNTDVVVPYQWLERLMIPIICQECVATTTPFTTCGTLCSFPDIGKDNKLVGDLSLWQMDDQFRNILPKYPEIPTGVGFCMGMNIDVVHKIGNLDEEAFGKGYGEENDWCRRAKEIGYKNVHVDNLFVYHKHGGSFLSEEKQKLLERNSKALLEKHPDYNEVVAAYFSMDPLKITRNYLLLNMWNLLLDIKTVVAFNHNLGGGATEYLIEKKNQHLRNGYKFITIAYDIDNDRYMADYQYKKQTISFSSYELSDVFNVIGRVDEIWINEVVTYRDLYGVMRKIVRWKVDQGAELKFLLHDYFAVCPAINLMDENGKYCAVGNVERCEACICDNISNACETYGTAQLWRENWLKFLNACDKIVTFSEVSKELLMKAYPLLENVELIPHIPHYVPRLDKKVKTSRTLNIGLLGILSYKKGLAVIQQLVKVIEEKKLDIQIKLIGAADESISSHVFTETGRYRREQLPRLTMELDIDIFFIPAIWPETFSYTTSEIMSMNMPIAVFDIGAPVERVSKYEKGLVLDCDLSAEKVLQKIVEFTEKCEIQKMPVNEEKILFIAQEISFASRYRVEHFREQLLHHGQASDYYQLSEVDDIDLTEYKCVVIYRCDDAVRVKFVVDKAKGKSIPVYYDIDDYIFDYEQITYLDFLKDDEYKDFENMSKNIQQCMECCDGYLTSTETLKTQILAHFPDKPVILKRNVASMEMQILSYNAAENKESDSEKIWIGYFSGSGTHNKDFDIVENVLDEIMSEYPCVNLRLGGVIKDTILKKYPNRVEKLPFMEWQKLPAALASVDINLMPLEDSLFHCCKSENKWTEAALVKVPSVMTRNAEMEQVITNGVNGILCTSKEEWKQALKSLIESKELRIQIAESANNTVLERYTTYHSGKEAIDFVTK